MSKNTVCLVLLVILMAGTSGCCTITGAANGMQQDVQNAANPDTNGWTFLKKADAWMQENMW